MDFENTILDTIRSIVSGFVSEKTIKDLYDIALEIGELAGREDVKDYAVKGFAQTIELGAIKSVTKEQATQLAIELFDNISKEVLAECTTSAAFGSFTPDHMIGITSSGSGSIPLTTRKGRTSSLGYTYSNPAEFQFKLRESGKVLTPKDLNSTSFTYLSYIDGKYFGEVTSDMGMYARVIDSMKKKFGEPTEGIPVDLLIDYADKEDFRIFIKSADPVYAEINNFRHGRDERPNKNMKDYRYKEPSVTVFAQMSLVFDNEQDAINNGWDV